MSDKPTIFCDLEGVLLPEMWPHLAETFAIPALRTTTREMPDYRSLMEQRLATLRTHGLTIRRVCKAVETLDLLPGALAFVQEVQCLADLVIVTDSFAPMNQAALAKLPSTRLLDHRFALDPAGYATECLYWNKSEGKHHCFAAVPVQRSRTFAIGDAFNDITMIRDAGCGSLFDPSSHTMDAAPDLPVAWTYTELLGMIRDWMRGTGAPGT